MKDLIITLVVALGLLLPSEAPRCREPVRAG